MPTEYAIDAIRTYGIDGIDHLTHSGRQFPGHAYEVFVRRVSGNAIIVRARHLRAEE